MSRTCRANGQPVHIPAGSPRRRLQGHLALAPRDLDHDRPRHRDGLDREPVFRRRRSEPAAHRRLRPQFRPLEASAPMAMRWYIVHAYSNFEKKVAESIREQAAHRGLAEKFEEILVPTEQVVEVRRGRKFNSERKFFPGYVLVKCDLTDQVYHLIKNTPKVTGFLGQDNKPMPISEAEADRIKGQVAEGVDRPKPTIHFDIGETVRVADGPFASFNGVVEEVDEGRSRVKVAVSIFGRATPVDLEFTQVEKV